MSDVRRILRYMSTNTAPAHPSGSDNDKAEVSRQRRAEGASSAEIREALRRLAEREQQPKHDAA